MQRMTQIALITGASRGLGFALAEALAPEYHIVAVGRTVGGLEDLDDVQRVFSNFDLPEEDLERLIA